jgi:phosphoserine phosphatase
LKRRAPKRRGGRGLGCRLEAPGWNDETRRALEDIINKGTGQHLPVVFDFDNTIICGDIGEATLAVLARSGVLTPARLARTTSPPFRVPGGDLMELSSCDDVTQYYEALLAPTAHEGRDPTPLANGYAWAVEIMENLSPLDVVNATRTAFEWPQPARPAFIEVTPGKTAFPVPFFYPEAVELIAELVRLRFDVWIVSASNVWSVRWMVLRALNPLLRQRGLKAGLAASHVVGISTLLADRQGRLYKDALLVREDDQYAAMAEEALAGLRLTSRLQFPVPTYSGKVAVVFDMLGRNPFLAVGDSPGDHPLLAVSQHRLWIARLEKPVYQRATRELIRKTGGDDWLIQPVLTRRSPGFVSGLKEASERLNGLPAEVREAAAAILRTPRQDASASEP